MKYFVKWNMFENITKPEDIGAVREYVSNVVPKLLESEKVLDHGVFTDGRAGYLILNVEKPADFFELAPFHDFCNLETHPVTDFRGLAEFFQENR